jgi:hypothetical protein
MTANTSKSQSAGARHGSNARAAGSDQAGTAAAEGKSPLGLNENTGEFRVGENIIFGMSNGNIKLRRSPQGDEVEVSEATLAGAMIDLFFTDKFEGQYDTVSAPKKSA